MAAQSTLTANSLGSNSLHVGAVWCPLSDVFETRSVVLAPIFVSKVLCSNFDATGTYFVTGCSDNVARVWAVSSAHSTGTAPLAFLAQFHVRSSACRLTVVNVPLSITRTVLDFRRPHGLSPLRSVQQQQRSHTHRVQTFTPRNPS